MRLLFGFIASLAWLKDEAPANSIGQDAEQTSIS